MSQKHNVAIICWNAKTDPAINIVNKLPAESKVIVFARASLEKALDIPECSVVQMPEDIDTQAKAKNFVIRWAKSNCNEGKLHVIEDTVEILKDPSEFMSQVERTMDLMDINSYLGTITDGCNRVYQKYNPRLRFKIDKPEWQKLGISELVFCSHSNTQWMVFDIGKGDENELTFCEDFKIAMFWIIEYLARRRNTHPGSMYFMNQYITCPEELGVYKNVLPNESDNIETPELMKAEDEIFKAKKVCYAPDNNIDEVLERAYCKLATKV